MVVFFSSRRRHTRYWRDWSSDVCSSDLSSGNEARTACYVLYRVWRRWLQHEGRKGSLLQNQRRAALQWQDRKSVVEGKSVDLGGCRIIKKKKKKINLVKE